MIIYGDMEIDICTNADVFAINFIELSDDEHNYTFEFEKSLMSGKIKSERDPEKNVMSISLLHGYLSYEDDAQYGYVDWDRVDIPSLAVRTISFAIDKDTPTDVEVEFLDVCLNIYPDDPSFSLSQKIDSDDLEIISISDPIFDKPGEIIYAN